MSHWKKFNSSVLENTDKDLLATALLEMGVELDHNIKSIRNTWGNESVDAGFIKDGFTIALGLNFKEVEGKETVELTGDFYSTGLNESTFIDKLSQLYQKHSITAKLEDNGWVVDSVEIDEKDEIVIDAYQYA